MTDMFRVKKSSIVIAMEFPREQKTVLISAAFALTL